jgi:hypothetical protein
MGQGTSGRVIPAQEAPPRPGSCWGCQRPNYEWDIWVARISLQSLFRADRSWFGGSAPGGSRYHGAVPGIYLLGPLGPLLPGRWLWLPGHRGQVG